MAFKEPAVEDKMNRIRFFTSGALFLFALYCLIWDPLLPFSLPRGVYIAATVYFALFPVKDMLPLCNHTLYKGRQFKKNYISNPELDETVFRRAKTKFDRRAFWALAFWIAFMAVPAVLYMTGVLDRIWIFFFFALSNFSVFFAIFVWCPFHSLFIRPECCMECRIFNWDSFFAYSFLIFIPNPYTVFLFSLGVLSLVEWEVMHALYPKRFYKESNCALTCENCDLEACRNHKKKPFHKELKEEYKEEPARAGNVAETFLNKEIEDALK